MKVLIKKVGFWGAFIIWMIPINILTIAITIAININRLSLYGYDGILIVAIACGAFALFIGVLNAIVAYTRREEKINEGDL